jgi:hypothetical protein
MSPAETDRLRAVLGSAGHTLAADDEQLPAGQRLAQRALAMRLEQAADDLTRRMLRAEQASVRLDVPVRLDAGEHTRVLGLLAQAAARLEQVAAHPRAPAVPGRPRLLPPAGQRRPRLARRPR